MAGVISGKVGALEFANARGGGVIRKRQGGVRKGSELQMSRRAWFRKVQGVWGELSDKERGAWVAAAALRTFPNRLGVERYLSGWQLFVRQNMDGRPLEVVNPFPPLVMEHLPMPYYLTLTATAGVRVEVDWTTVTPPADPYTLFSGARTVSVRPRTVFRGWRYLLSVLTGVGAHNFDLTRWWDILLGLPMEGEVIAVKACVWDADFLRSFWVTAQCVTGP